MLLRVMYQILFLRADIQFNMSNTNVLRDVHIDRALSPLSPLNTLLNQPRDLGKWQILPHTNL